MILEPLMVRYFRLGASDFWNLTGFNFTSHLISWKETASVYLHNNEHQNTVLQSNNSLASASVKNVDSAEDLNDTKK